MSLAKSLAKSSAKSLAKSSANGLVCIRFYISVPAPTQNVFLKAQLVRPIYLLLSHYPRETVQIDEVCAQVSMHEPQVDISTKQRTGNTSIACI